MLSVRDQENLVSRHQTGAVLKQQQNNQLGSRYPKTPIKIPLNDENAGPMKGGAKSVLGNRTRGNENAPTSKGVKGLDKSNFVTPMQPRARAVLGDKTTNAKAGGAVTGGKGLEKSAKKAGPNTARPKQKQPQAETHKLQILAEQPAPLVEEEPEYCPPKPADIPYESDVFPDGVLSFEMLKEENLFKGYYQHYYNPVDENGVSRADKELAQKTQKALDDGDRRIKEDMESFEWSIQNEIDGTKDVKPAAVAVPSVRRTKDANVPKATRRPLGTVASRTAASVLSMEDTTKSLQRRTARVFPAPIPKKKATSFALPVFRSTRPSTTAKPLAVKRAPMSNIEANSRSTLGYTKGRAAATVLSAGRPTVVRPKARLSSTTATRKVSLGAYRPRATGLPRARAITAMDPNKTITPASFAGKQAPAAEDDEQQWKERVPFLSIFSPGDALDDEDDFDLAGGALPDLDDDDEFEMQIPE